MEDTVNRRHHYIPAFGDWDYSDDLPITQYFESAMQAGLLRGHFRGEALVYDDLFKASRSVKEEEEQSQFKKVKRGGPKQQQQQIGQERNQGKKLYDAGTAAQAKPRRAPMAVDEDLYKIPPELLHKKPTRVNLISFIHHFCSLIAFRNSSPEEDAEELVDKLPAIKLQYCMRRNIAEPLLRLFSSAPLSFTSM